MGSNPSKIAFEICVVTGDYQGDPLGPGVVLIMFDDQGHQSPLINLEHLFQNEVDFSQARFTIDLQDWSSLKNFAKLHHIEFWRTNTPVNELDWYLDRVIFRDRRKGLTGEWEYFFFPVHDWILPNGQFVIHNAETWLPKFAPYPDVRRAEITRRLETYNFFQRAKGLPVELEEVPMTEIFSYDQKWELEPIIQDLIRRAKLTVEYTSLSPWDSLESLGGIYKKYNITQPTGVQLWMMNDICFGAQRIRGCNPFVIQKCTQLPDCFLPVAETLKPYLEGWSLKTLIQANRLYMVDYSIMRGLQCQDNRYMCAPIALFVYTERRQLVPLCIKMNSETNEGQPIEEPVILSRPGCNLWLQAKLWFNMVDACHHMIAQRLLTHMILESIYASLRRNMAQANPIYQLFAPHFRSFLVVNRKFKSWVFENGWIARCCQLSMKGIRILLKRAFKYWTFDVNANFYRELQSRGVYDGKNGLNNYPYRDDARRVYMAFERFCMAYLRLYYPSEEHLLDDTELQGWRTEMATPMQDGGLGIQKVPGSRPRPKGTINERNGGSVLSGGSDPPQEELFLCTYEEAKNFLCGIWYLTVIVAGSSLRLGMFEEYGFPAQYPLCLAGVPPPIVTPPEEGTNGGTMNSQRSGSGSSSSGDVLIPRIDDIVHSLPCRAHTIETIMHVRLAHRVVQSKLGHFESDYIFEPNALRLLEEFRRELAEVSVKVKEHNTRRDMYHQYFSLDPEFMPNYPGL